MDGWLVAGGLPSFPSPLAPVLSLLSVPVLVGIPKKEIFPIIKEEKVTPHSRDDQKERVISSSPAARRLRKIFQGAGARATTTTSRKQ